MRKLTPGNKLVNVAKKLVNVTKMETLMKIGASFKAGSIVKLVPRIGIPECEMLKTWW